MRLFETLFVIATVAILFLPHQRYARGTLVSIAALLILAFLHLILEGARWQIIPAYFVAVVWLLLAVARANLGSWLGWLGVIGGTLFCVIALALGYLFPIIKLRPLTGQYAVGTATYFITDESRPEIYSDDPNAVRRLNMQIWYPAELNGEPRAPYVPDLSVGGAAIAAVFDFPSFILNHARLIETHVHLEPTVADDAPFPILFFSHGLSGVRVQNMQQVEQLVSHGYIVVATDHAYAAAFTVYPGGEAITYDANRVIRWDTPAEIPDAQRLVQVWSADLSTMLAHLEQLNADDTHPLNNAFNFDQIGVFGHSTGGGTSYEFCYREARCRAAFGLDPWVVPTSDEAVQTGLNDPIAIMKSPVELSELNHNRLETLWDNSDRAIEIEVAETEHFDFTDIKRLSPLLETVGLVESIDADQIDDMMTAYLLDFFNFHLRGWEGALLFADSAEFPEADVRRK